MKFERTVRKVGNSVGFLIPTDVSKYMELEDKTPIIIEVKDGKFGKYVAFWRKDEDKNPTQEAE